MSDISRKKGKVRKKFEGDYSFIYNCQNVGGGQTWPTSTQDAECSGKPKSDKIQKTTLNDLGIGKLIKVDPEQ